MDRISWLQHLLIILSMLWSLGGTCYPFACMSAISLRIWTISRHFSFWIDIWEMTTLNRIIYFWNEVLTTFSQILSAIDSRSVHTISRIHSHNYTHSLNPASMQMNHGKWVFLFVLYYYYLRSFPFIRLCRVKVIKLFTFENKEMIYDWSNGQRNEKRKKSGNEEYIWNKLRRKFCEWFWISDAHSRICKKAIHGTHTYGHMVRMNNK